MLTAMKAEDDEPDFGRSGGRMDEEKKKCVEGEGVYQTCSFLWAQANGRRPDMILGTSEGCCTFPLEDYRSSAMNRQGNTML